MSRHDDALPLRHMLDHAREIEALTRDRRFADLDTDRTFQLAVFHLFGILGEAANRVSLEFRRAHPEIDWRGIIGLRNYLMHAYDRVDRPTVWRAAREDVPALVAVLERILG
jgi:uncharacterized protein with HEPN domain